MSSEGRPSSPEKEKSSFWSCSEHFGDNKQTSAAQVQKDLASILMNGEQVQLCFKEGRDSTVFTSHRLLLVDTKGLSSKKVQYQSIRYSAILVFAVETAGGLMDRDSELKIWSQVAVADRPMYTEIEFKKDAVDIYAIQTFVASKVLGASSDMASKGEQRQSTTSGNLVDWLSDNGAQVSAEETERYLRTEAPILQPEERVEMAFKAGRDMAVLTTNRLLTIDTARLSSKKVAFISEPWSSIGAFSVEFAGGLFDRDAEVRLWNKVPIQHFPRKFDVTKDVDIFAIQTVLLAHIVGQHASPLDCSLAHPTTISPEGAGGFLAWLGDDGVEVDPREIEDRLRNQYPLLHKQEHVGIAYKIGRHTTVLTSHRIICIDPHGLLGKSVEFITIPYSSVGAFSVCTAGGKLDRDAEFMIWTTVYPPPPERDEDGEQVQLSGKHAITQDLRKGRIDPMAIQKLMAAKVTEASNPALAIKMSDLGLRKDLGESDGSGFLEWVTGNASQVNPHVIEQKVRATSPVLLEPEHVENAFVMGRDALLLTTHRVLALDVKGLSGKKVQYTTLPYRSLRAFSVESAGSFDQDCECALLTNVLWLPRIKMEVRKATADIFAIQSVLANKLMGTEGTRFVPQDGLAGGEALQDWLSDNKKETDPEVIEKQFRSCINLLLPEEKVCCVGRKRRNTILFTDKRVLVIDVSGLTGKQTEYFSIPYCSTMAFATESGGGFDRTEEVKAWTDMPDKGEIEIEFRKGTSALLACQAQMCKGALQG